MADYKRGVVYYDAFNIYGTFRNKKHQTRMDVVDNNLSNVNTVGFKSGRAMFSDVLSQTITWATAANGTVGGTNPKQIGLGVGIGSVDTIFTNGAPITTDINTDLCLSGDGLFVVKKNNETFYTRNGAFSFDAEGNYVMLGSGHIVQGWMANNGVIDTNGAVEDIKVTIGKPLAKATDGDAGATLTDVQIDSSGIVTGIYSNGVRRQEAQVAIAHFNNPAGLFKTGTSLYKESANSGDPLLIKAGEFDVSIMTGALEMSNVNIANEFSDMIITQRGFQSNSNLITVGDEMLDTAINMKR